MRNSRKLQIVKNTHHYRDREQRIGALEADIGHCIGEALGGPLCALLKASEPRIYKDQLVVGARGLLRAHEDLNPALIAYLCEKPYLSTTMLRDYLTAYAAHPERLNTERSAGGDTGPPPGQSMPARPDAPLARYAGIGADNREVAHDLH